MIPPLQPELISAPGLAVVYVPPSWEGEMPPVTKERMCVMVRDMFEPIVAVFPPEASGRAAESTPEDKLMLLLEPALLGKRATVAPTHEWCDPHLFSLAHTMRCGFRVGRPPTPAYLRILAPLVASHLRQHYALGRGLAADRLMRVIAYVDARLDQSIGIDDLARSANLSSYHFSRMFRRSMGMTPHDYITQRRTERAKELLVTSDLLLADIAGRVGYQTQAHFTRAFHEATGTTPLRYRRDQQASRPATSSM